MKFHYPNINVCLGTYFHNIFLRVAYQKYISYSNNILNDSSFWLAKIRTLYFIEI